MLLWPEYLRAAVRLWLTQPAQALLSMLGIAAGIAGLFVVLALGRGAESEINAAMERLGAGTILISPLPSSLVDGRSTLTPQFLLGLEQLLPASLEFAAPNRVRTLTAISSAGQALEVDVKGVLPVQARLSEDAVQRGRFLVDLDVKLGSRVCVLGAGLARALYPRGDAIGQQLRLGQNWHRVVGVLPDDGLLLGRVDKHQTRKAESVYVPVNGPLFARDEDYAGIALRFRNEAALSAAMPLIHRAISTATLQERIALQLPLAALRSQYRVQRTVAILLLAASLVTLVIAGVSMMNTMLLNVAARRAEIGLRRAVGATRTHVLGQFLLEAVVLSASGGLAGLLSGLLASAIVVSLTGWPLSLGTASVTLALFTAIVIGAAFGGYPAWRAAGLAPVDTLRGPV